MLKKNVNKISFTTESSVFYILNNFKHGFKRGAKNLKLIKLIKFFLLNHI